MESLYLSPAVMRLCFLVLSGGWGSQPHEAPRLANKAGREGA